MVVPRAWGKLHFWWFWLVNLFYVIITLVPVFTVILVHVHLERVWWFWQHLMLSCGTKMHVRWNQNIFANCLPKDVLNIQNKQIHQRVIIRYFKHFLFWDYQGLCNNVKIKLDIIWKILYNNIRQWEEKILCNSVEHYMYILGNVFQWHQILNILVTVNSSKSYTQMSDVTCKC